MDRKACVPSCEGHTGRQGGTGGFRPAGGTLFALPRTCHWAEPYSHERHGEKGQEEYCACNGAF